MNFNEFTNRYQYTKCFKLALIPQGKTSETIKNQKFHEFDNLVYDKIERLKPVIDAFVLEIVSKSLNNFEFTFMEYNNALDNLETAIKGTDEYNKAKKNVAAYETKLTEEIVNAFINNIPDELYSKDGLSKFLSAPLLKTVLPAYIKTTKNNTFDKADAIINCETLSNASASVLPCYRSRITAMETWIPEREIENFAIYRKNIAKINKLIENEDIPEIHQFLTENEEFRSFVSPESFILTMTQEGVQAYNDMIGGILSNDGIVSKGINMITNELNAKNKQDRGYKGPFFSKLSMLKKIPLAPVEKQYVLKAIVTDEEVIEILDTVTADSAKLINSLLSLIDKHPEDSLFTNGRNLHMISHVLYGDHNKIPDIYEEAYIEECIKSLNGKKMTKKVQKLIDNAKEAVRGDYYKISDISDVTKKNILSSLFSRLMELSLAVSSSSNFSNLKKIKGNRNAEESIQRYYDILKEFKDTANILYYDGDDADADTVFYNSFNQLIKDLNNQVKSQNRIRNYITKKPGDITKEIPTYLGSMQRMENQWWHIGEKFEKKNFSILQKDSKYYYFCLTNEAKSINIETPSDNEDVYMMRSQYKPPKGAAMDLPKFILARRPVAAKSYFEKNPSATSYTVTEGFSKPFTVTREEYDICVSKKYVKAANDVESARKYMAMIKRFITTADLYSSYDFSNINEPEDYELTNDMYTDIDRYSLALKDIPVSAELIDSLVENGKALLFLITNKSMYGKRKKTDHYASLFIEAMSDMNKKTLNMQLNSRPKIMYRPVVIEEKYMPAHKKDTWLLNKRDINGKPIPPEIYTELYEFKNNLRGKTLSKNAKAYLDFVTFKRAEVDIIKDKRFTKESFTLTMSYMMNKKAPAKNKAGWAPDRINDRINDNGNGTVISITRSTRHLLYYTVTTKDKKILEERSLNVIDGYDYMEKIRQISKIRSDEKKSWCNETTVKDLKDGYCRRAITEIIRAVNKFDATAVLCEFINDDFKDKWSCIDNQLYKGFEKKLNARLANIKSLDKAPYEPGGIMNPIQLADESGNNYQDGILNYVSNSYIRSMDAENGFCPIFKKNQIKTAVQKRNFFNKMKEIVVSDDAITLSFDYSDFDVIVKTDKKDWTVIISGPCDEYDREHKCYKRTDNMVSVIADTIPSSELAKATKTNTGLDISNLMYDLPVKTIETLWKYFMLTIDGRTIIDDDETYKSPTTGATVIKPLKNALLQVDKYELMKSKDKSDDSNEYWLNKKQA